MGGQGRGLLAARLQRGATGRQAAEFAVQAQLQALVLHALALGQHLLGGLQRGNADRKSTRLNSSHLVISYAVFCLKKKKKPKTCHSKSDTTLRPQPAS